jgi:hypothetical protein
MGILGLATKISQNIGRLKKEREKGAKNATLCYNLKMKMEYFAK